MRYRARFAPLQPPRLTTSRAVEDIVAHPYEVVSDSFYFAGGKLIIHNKALFRYYEAGGRRGRGEEKLETGNGKGESKLDDDTDRRMHAKLGE